MRYAFLDKVLQRSLPGVLLINVLIGGVMIYFPGHPIQKMCILFEIMVLSFSIAEHLHWKQVHLRTQVVALIWTVGVAVAAAVVLLAAPRETSWFLFAWNLLTVPLVGACCLYAMSQTGDTPAPAAEPSQAKRRSGAARLEDVTEWDPPKE